MIDIPLRDRHGTVCKTLTRRGFLGRAARLGITAAAATALPGAVPASAAGADGDLFLLGLEEHFATPELQRLNGIRFPKGVPRFDIDDVGAGRIADMDAAGIDMQVLSALTPGAQNLPGAEGVAYARKLNSWVANEVVPAWPDGFRAFATLPLSVPEAAPDELEYAVRELGFVGCMTYGAIHGKFLDHADFAPVLARAEALGVPIYIHPNWASPRVMDIYYNGLGNEWVSRVLSGAGYGWHQEVALQCLRMISSGVFDRFPRLQIIVGHMGEGLPFLDDDQRVLPRRTVEAGAVGHGRGPGDVRGGLSVREQQGRRGLVARGRPAPDGQGEDRPQERRDTSRHRPFPKGTALRRWIAAPFIRGSPLGSLTGCLHPSASEIRPRMDNLLRDHN